MLDFVVQLTKDATKISRDDHAKLPRRGLRRQRNSADYADRVLV